jgi:hypothetical protein
LNQTTRRTALIAAAAALLPLSARGGQRKKRRRRCRRTHIASVTERNLCRHPACSLGNRVPCGNGCFCLGAGAGPGWCVRPLAEDSPLCGGSCPTGVCLETCDHPGEARCYEFCAP